MRLLLDENLSRQLVDSLSDLFPESTHSLPPKVIWLRGCDYPTAVAERLIRGQAIGVTEFLQDPDRAVLIFDTAGTNCPVGKVS